MAEEKQLVSLLLLAYNQERFVLEAMRSALSQTYSPLEIIVSDDYSTDKTYDIIEAEASAYRGPHRIIINRNRKNLGLAANLNRAWELSSGQFIVAQAGDDISIPDRTEKLVRRWRDRESPVDLVCSYFAEIDEHGRQTGYIKKEVAFMPDTSLKPLFWRCGATGACAGYSRKLYDKYGPLDVRVLAEDWVLSFRAWLELGIAVVEEPLVKHRTHNNSISVIHRNLKTTKNLALRAIRRRQAAENELARAEEWLRAWQLGGKKEARHIEEGLQRLVRIHELQLRAFESTPLVALKLAILTLMAGGGLLNAARIIVRHVMRMD